MRWMCWAALVLAGCGATINGDQDLDGYLSAADGGSDCDDGDAAVHPGAEEICGDGVDNDCDGVTDDRGQGSVPWYVDADGDGYGAEKVEASGCPGHPPAEGLAELPGDCDDAAAEVNPGVKVDACDLVDEDCDELVDEDAPAALVASVAYESAAEALAAAVKATGPVVVEICAQPEPIAVGSVPVIGDLTVRGMGGAVPPVLTEAGGATLFAVSGQGALALDHLHVTGSVSGPAVRVQDLAQLVVQGSEVRDNPGGGIALGGTDPGKEGEPLTVGLFDVALLRNGTTARDGGGLRAEGWFDLELDGVLIEGNRADRGGGIYAHTESDLVPGAYEWRDVQVIGNQAVEGGGVYLRGMGVNLLSTLVQENTAQGGAGGVLFESVMQGLSNTEVLENTATDRAGGLLLQGSALTTVRVSGNVAAEGGGIAVEHVAPSSALSLLTGVWLEANEAQVGGGLQVGYGAAANVNSGTVVANHASLFGGGAYLVGGGSSLTSHESHWGTSKGDNTPNDVELVSGESFDFGDATNDFTCTDEPARCE